MKSDSLTRSCLLLFLPALLPFFFPFPFYHIVSILLFSFSYSYLFQTGTRTHKHLWFKGLRSSFCISFSPFPYCLHCPILPTPLALVSNNRVFCDSKLRKQPIKSDVHLTGEREGGAGVCIKAKERVIWRYLSWTGQFPVSGTGQKYPETEKSSRRGKDTPPRFSCDLPHSAN